jgi:hypothetical protein
MNQITEIIENALDSHPDLAGNHANADIAQVIAQKLVTASLQQLASVIGGGLDYEDDGRIVVRSRFYDDGQTLDARVANSWDRA